MPRPRSLSADRLAAAALAVIDESGLEAFTMRAVAEELGMATMSLYRYVADRRELELLVVNHLYRSVDLDLPGSGWAERVDLLLDRVRLGVSRHPGTVPLFLKHRQSAPASLDLIETLLNLLAEGGFEGSDRVIAQRTLIHYLVGYLQAAHYAPLSGGGTEVMAGLDQADFPHLTRTAAIARTMSGDDEFRGGLEIVLRGLRPDGG